MIPSGDLPFGKSEILSDGLICRIASGWPIHTRWRIKGNPPNGPSALSASKAPNGNVEGRSLTTVDDFLDKYFPFKNCAHGQALRIAELQSQGYLYLRP